MTHKRTHKGSPKCGRSIIMVDHELALSEILDYNQSFDHFLLQIHKGMSLPIRKSTRNDISRQVLNAYKLIKIGYYYKLYKLCNIKIEY